MAIQRKDSTPTPAAATPAAPAPAPVGSSDNSASELIEAPQKPAKGKLDPHDFAIGGGSGGGEAFSRKKTK
jgi:hypothetical protein